MSLYGDHVLPRLITFAMRGKPFQEVRAEYLAGASGVVLEAGFGAGLNRGPRIATYIYAGEAHPA